MYKGFGDYSPHETTTFFLKALLLSFWAGMDLMALLVLLSFPLSMLLQHQILLIGMSAVLIAGTVFSVLFAWATGSTFGCEKAQNAHEAYGPLRHALLRVRRDPAQLAAAGIVVVALLVVGASALLSTLKREREEMKEVGRADPVVARKCREVASMERQLFQSDPQSVTVQCLLQYDDTYAPLRKS
jgi:hypothetical protein